jgi:hypothetical protein
MYFFKFVYRDIFFFFLVIIFSLQNILIRLVSSTSPTQSPTYFIATPSLHSGLVAYYPFDGDVNDDSGNGNHGTNHGASSQTDRHGNAGGCYHLDGSGDYMEFPGADFNFVNNFTLAMWIKPTSTQDAYATLFDKAHWSTSLGRTPYGWSLQQNVGNVNQYSLNWVPVDGTEYMGNYIQTTGGQWNHLVFMKAGSSTIAYLNGVFASKQSLGSNANLIANNKPLVIGGANGGQTDPATISGSRYSGLIDEVFIYNRTITAQEVKMLYQIHAPTSQPSTSPTSQPSSKKDDSFL